MVERRPLLTRPLPSGRVCRSLFGPVDHEETNRVLQREVARVKDEYRRKYNFDFDTDTPLPGLYEWRVENPATVSAANAATFGSGIRGTGVVPAPRLAAPVALRLTIKHHQAALSSEGEEDETEPETPGSSRGSSDESDCDLESPLERCIRHQYDLRSIHPASTPSATPSSVAISASTSVNPTTSSASTSSSSSSASSTTSQQRLPVANASSSSSSSASASAADCTPPVTLDPIVEGCRSPVDPNSPSQPRQTKITDFLRQRKRKLSAADSLNKKILRGSPFRAAAASAVAAPAALAAASPGLGFEAAAAGPSVQ